MADLPPEEGGDQRAAGRPRLEEADREPPRGGGRRHAARGLDQVEAPGEAALGEGGFELGDVPGHEGLHVGVGRGGRAPLVFPELGDDLGGERHGQAGVLAPDHVGHRALVGRVAVGVEEADGEGLDPGLDEVGDLAAGLLLVERHDHAPVAVQTLVDLPAEGPRDERLRKAQEQIVDVVALLGSHLEDVPEPTRRQETERAPVPLDDRVGH